MTGGVVLIYIKDSPLASFTAVCLPKILNIFLLISPGGNEHFAICCTSSTDRDVPVAKLKSLLASSGVMLDQLYKNE